MLVFVGFYRFFKYLQKLFQKSLEVSKNVNIFANAIE